jgi:hypothetical protein
MNNLTEVWEKEIRPPSSPDCIPFDYFAGGVSELRVRANPADLIPYIWEVIGFLARNTVAKACNLQEVQVHVRYCRHLTAISMNKLILSKFLCQPVITLIKSNGF